MNEPLRIVKGSRVVAEVKAVGNVSVAYRCDGERREVYVECRLVAYEGDGADERARAKINEIAELAFGP